MVFIQNLKPRNDIFILNHYEIIYHYNNDFHLIIYFLKNNKCKIIIRKMNQVSGWIHNLEIKIYDKQDTKKFEVINIGTSNQNVKILNYYLKDIKLHKKIPKKIKIPKIIFQTHKSNEINNVLAINSIYTFQELNPDYEYLFFDNIQCREFIKNNFNDEYLFYYDILFPGAFKADFFRYCFLYIKGGCYFDCKNILLKQLDDLISKNDELILTQDYHNTGYYNAVMMSAPKNKLFIELINTIKYKIKNFNNIYKKLSNFEFNKLETFLSLTGPNLLYEVFHKLKLSREKHILMKHDILGNHQNYKNLIVKFKDKLFLYKNYANFEIPKKHYSKQWKNNEIFYYNHIFNNEHQLFVEPNKDVKLLLELEFYFINDKIMIINKKYTIVNTSFNLYIIDEQSNEYIKNINNQLNSKNYYLEDYKSKKEYNYFIKKVIFLEKVNNEKNFYFEINKIRNDYILIILNEKENNWKKLNINIKTKSKEFTIKINKKNNYHFYIVNINDYYV